jgi:DNA-binding MarR family transcriptional regulator
MSFETMAWALEKDCKNPAAKLVLLMLANGQTDHELLAKQCNMTPETLKRHIRSLQNLGLITALGQIQEVKVNRGFRMWI